MQGCRRGAVDPLRFLLGDEPAIGREQRIEFQRPEERVVAEIESDECAELDDLLLRVVLAELIEERRIDGVGIACRQFAVAQRQLVRLGEAVALRIAVDALVQQIFG